MSNTKRPLNMALNTLHVFKSISDLESKQNDLDGVKMALVGDVEIVKVGGIYMSTLPDDPSLLFGGRWIALNEGRALVSAGNAYPLGSKGGESSVNLSERHLPRHDHYITVSSNSSHYHVTGYGERGFGSDDGGAPGNADSRGSSQGARSSTNGYHSHSFSIGSAGGSSSHNNMMPYHAVYMWQRIE